MTPTFSHPNHPLHDHPATPAGLPLAVSATLDVTLEGLRLVYTVGGDVTRLRMPPPAEPGPADGLWQHTCLEAFVAVDGDQAYREFNFSPSGQWAAYGFASERVRAGEGVNVDPPPSVHFMPGTGQFTLMALVPWTALPQRRARWHIALSAVIEESNGQLSYWALQHPRERPDFHHPAGRALRLDPPLN